MGTGSQAGYQTNGAWSVGDGPTASSYLAGGFGAERVADEPDQRPALDDGTTVKTTLLNTADPTFAGDTSGSGGTGTTALADGKLTITVGKFGWPPLPADGDGLRGADTTWMRLDDGSDDTDEDTMDATAKYEVNLAELLAKEGGEYNLNGAIHRQEARNMIEAERKKLAVLIETDQLPMSQAAIWRNVQDILLTRIFNASAAATDDPDDAALAGRLPDKVAGEYDKDMALETIDDILWALNSDSNLEAALDKDELALFVQEDDTPFVGRAPGDIFAEKELQVKAWVGTTDFTRFGVWRVRRTRNAQGTGGWVDGEMDSFGYSPLDISKVSSTTAPNYPGGASATYGGSSVAFVGPTGYTSDAEVHVKWDAGSIGASTVTAVLSNFSSGNGEMLYHSGNLVREIVFDNENIQHNPATGGPDGGPVTDNVLRFGDGTANATVRYGGSALGSGTSTGTAAGATLSGVFVGASPDGPLGVLGRYSLTGGGFGINDGQTDRSITGAFGADLP